MLEIVVWYVRPCTWSSICTASSRVGASTSARVAAGRVGTALRKRCRIGTRNAAVLPVPVSAQAMTSPPASASGITPLWTDRVSVQPRSLDAAQQPRVERRVHRTGSAPDRRPTARRRQRHVRRRQRAVVPARAARRPRPAAARWAAAACRCAVMNAWSVFSTRSLTCAEGDDAADRIVGRDADGHAVAGHDLDAEAAHPAAQLRQHFVAGVALHAVQARRSARPRPFPACRSDRLCSIAHPFTQS